MGSTEAISRPESGKHKAQLAKLIGVNFLFMFFLGIFAEFAVRLQLIRWEDPILIR